jgi:hypothetical protein
MYDIPLLILLLVCFAVRNFAFSGRTTRMRQVSAAAPARMGLENSMGLLAKSNDEKEMDPLTKASWYGVELFGKVFGDKVKQNVCRNNTVSNRHISFILPFSHVSTLHIQYNGRMLLAKKL